ncbi:MAG: serine/threonine protein kinase [Ktedonobacteraceae bacterium]|nr:serine/threonine protein kinase [Ktedonobacteraceae bacterium]
MEEQTSRRFGNYDLVQRIDVGGMGEVYLARQRTAFDREVAIKIIRSDLMHDTTARKRFLREAEVHAHLTHEHILTMIEFGEEQGRLFFVTPYIEGGTLAQHLHNGPLELARVHELFTPLVQAVAYIHGRGVIHRDLKPGNVLLDQDSDGRIHVRLIDFGIAAIQGSQASEPLTTAGHEMGTAAYMAPERRSGVAAPSNDIYSLGIMLYQMLTGHLPTAAQGMAALSGPMTYVVRRCMATKLEERFASAEELLKAFEYAYQYMQSPQGHSPEQTDISPGSLDTPVPLTAPSPPPVRPQPRPAGKAQPEGMASQRSAGGPPPQPKRRGTFERSDYEAPTVSVNMLGVQGKYNSGSTPTHGPTPAKAPRRPRRRRNLLHLLLTITMVLVILAIAGLLVLEVSAISSVTINISPRTTAISQVFNITARAATKQVDLNTASIPATELSASRTGTQQGQTTGQQCDFFHINCQSSVDATDEGRLVAQVKKSLVSQISQDLTIRLRGKNAQQLGPPTFFDASVKTDPPVGTLSKTLSVTLTESGSVAYFLNKDARTLAEGLLAQQLQQQGPGYHFKLTQIGQAVIRSVDTTTGTVHIAIPAAGVAQYTFPAGELSTIQNHVKGMKLADAIAYIKQRPGIDPNSVTIHFTAGNGTTLPTDIQHIQITSINPTSLPPLLLPTVTTPSPNLTPGATPTASVSSH